LCGWVAARLVGVWKHYWNCYTAPILPSLSKVRIHPRQQQQQPISSQRTTAITKKKTLS
jgi:hypothetical protein